MGTAARDGHAAVMRSPPVASPEEHGLRTAAEIRPQPDTGLPGCLRGAPRQHHGEDVSRLAAGLGERKQRHAGRSRLYRIGFATEGFAVLAAGLAMLVLPGPGLLVTALALGMLALEFHWAERLLLRAARLGGDGRDRLRGMRPFGRLRRAR